MGQDQSAARKETASRSSTPRTKGLKAGSSAEGKVRVRNHTGLEVSSGQWASDSGELW